MDDQVKAAAAPAKAPAAVRLKGTGRKVLFSAMKNEAPFLLEWVAYHKVIGFDEIVICSNPSNDGTEELLAALAKAGVIKHLQATVPAGSSPQYMATQAFEREIGFRDDDWYLWLDADEFLNVHVGDHSVGALVDAMGDKQIALINWRIFGSSGQAAFPGRFIDPAFSGAAEPEFPRNNALKTFFRHSPAIRGFARHGIHRPLIAPASKLTLDDVLVGNGKRPSPDNKIHARWLKGKDSVFTNQVTPDEAGWALAQVNHYIVRTRDVYELKRRRGRGYLPKGGVGSAIRHNAEFFAQHDRNEAEDRTILRWQDAVTAEIAGFMKQRAIATALRAADRKSKAELAAALAEPQQPPVPVKVAAPVASAPARRKLAEGEAPRRVLFSAMKNEAPFLLEWVAYHKVIGFDEIIICSNPSNDGTEELLAALAKAGEIRHLRATVPPGASPQYRASQAFEQKVGFRDGNWYMWLDADEFLNVHIGDRTVGALVEAIGDKQVALVNWRIFGSSGNKAFPGRFVSEAFSRAAHPSFALNQALKAFFLCSPAIRGFARHGIHRPRIARNSALRAEDVVVGSGKSASAGNKIHRRWLNGDDIVRTSRVGGGDFGWALAQINHYIVRTEDYFVLKALRGRGYMPRQKVESNNRHTPEFFAQHDRNEAEDRSILAWQDRVGEEIARLARRPGVAKAIALSSKKVAEIMEELKMAQPKPDDGLSAAVVNKVSQKEARPPSPTFKLTFPGPERAFVRAHYAKAPTILEYGSGGSTVLAIEGGSQVFSVESDKAWAARLSAKVATMSNRAHVHHVDIGPTTYWGKPRSTETCDRFHRYALSVWDRPDFQHPDLVLIDGRFRAACLAAVKMRATKPTTVLFDDYVERDHYHAVERLAVKEEVVGRMARFTVTPGLIPPDMLTLVIGWFTDPR
jgi:Glycosyl transferase family 2